MRIELDGLEVTVFRSSLDGKLCIAIQTEDLSENDVHVQDDVPDIRISINEQDLEILETGELKEI